jgi:hypothetical protein
MPVIKGAIVLTGLAGSTFDVLAEVAAAAPVAFVAVTVHDIGKL